MDMGSAEEPPGLARRALVALTRWVGRAQRRRTEEPGAKVAGEALGRKEGIDKTAQGVAGPTHHWFSAHVP